MDPQNVLQQFLEEPGGHLVMDADLRILDAGPEFVRMTKTRREDLIGKEYPNILTEPDTTRHIEALNLVRTGVATAVKTRRAYAVKVHRSDLVDPETQAVEERWWKPTITPVFENGEIRCMVLRMEDVTTTERTFRLLGVQRRLIYVLSAMLLLGVILVAIAFASQESRTSDISAETCRVQEEGIQGNHLLGHVMADIQGLIVNSPKPHQKIPPKEVKFGLVLENDLVLYLKLIHSLPTHRQCS